ncbi:MAG: glycosyltransferase family 2 protein [Acidimicrobiales bacterium]
MTTGPLGDDELRFQSLSIVFPMWNEEAYVEATLAAAAEVCLELVASREIGDYELVVVNDASTDATGAIADRLAAGDRHVKVVHHGVNRSLGASVRSGFGAATGELVLYTDADLPCDLAEAAKACRLLRYHNADIVSAYRHDRTGEGPRRALYSWIYNWLVRLTLGLYLRDVNFAFKLCRRGVLDKIELQSEGSFFDVELLVRATRKGYKVIQFGVDYFPRSRGVSTLSSSSVIVKIIRDMVALRRELRRTGPASPPPL